uniref:Putative ovule protein n=1 Tax=Solanum chacoense TaxID=4108 RepID=A0A0V0H5G7_SOLCH
MQQFQIQRRKYSKSQGNSVNSTRGEQQQQQSSAIIETSKTRTIVIHLVRGWVLIYFFILVVVLSI